MSAPTSFKLQITGFGLALALPVFAHGGAEGGEKVVVQQEQALADAPGKKGLMVTVAYEPGQQSIAHVHAGSVFAYVLEGAVVSQLGDQPPVTYHAGQSWYEPANIPHRVSRNASDKQPAKLLVWLLLDERVPVLTPLHQ